MKSIDIVLNEGIPNELRPEGLRFVPCRMPAEYYDYRVMMKIHGLSEASAIVLVEENHKEVIFRSRDWQVHIKSIRGNSGWPSMLHLNCRRTDRSARHDWRELQSIKNILVGPEHEAVELYPAESRLTDTANNYHLWVLASAKARFPFGFLTRAVFSEKDAEKHGAKQRNMDSPHGNPSNEP
jgi:hypothetical protein